MEFRILGPLEVVVEGRRVPLDAAKPRALLAILLVRARGPVSSDRLIDDLWAGSPPASAPKILQTYVSTLRKALGRGAIVTTSTGYELSGGAGDLDLHRFEQLLTEARAGTPAVAADKLRGALALWRGPPLGDFAFEPWAQAEIARLEELRVDALQNRVDADLALGRSAELVGELESLIAEYPLRERLRGQLMLALYRSGRQAEALSAYRAARETLVEQLGIEPGGPLRQLERAILDQDPKLDVSVVEPALAAPEPLSPKPRRRSSSFVGRKKELREIRALLARGDVRLLTLTGPAGTGKTRLAVEATSGGLAGDAIFVELAPISDAGVVARTIAATLGLSETSGHRSTETLVTYLRARPALLVLDNFEQVLEAAPVVAELLAGAPDVRLIVTSRAPIDLPEESIYPVPPLKLPDPSSSPSVDRLRQTEAVRLFVERARDARSDFALSEENAEAVAELCRRLDGLPLALELLKAEPGARLAERHRTLRAAIEWSYDLLGAEEQALFADLGAFVGGFTLDGAEAVAGELELDLVGGLETLLNNSLLRTERMSGDEPRFGMFETIRDFALERLAERGDDQAVRRRHAQFFLRLAKEAEPALLGSQQMRWLQRLDSERGNLRAALTWATESGEAEIGLQTAASLWRFWQMRAADAEGREHLDRLLDGGSGSPSTRAFGQSRAASLALYQGDFKAVRRYLEASLPVHRELGDEWNLSAGLLVLIMTLLADGDANKARSVAEEALDVARRTRNPTSEAYALAHLGVVLAAHGELDEGQRLLEESVRRARELGNLRSVANWTKALGGIGGLQGDYPRARELFEQSLAIYRSLDDPWGTLGSLSGLALVALEEHDNRSARRLLEENLELLRKSGHHFRVANSLEIAARLAAAQDRDRGATRLYGAASAFRGSMAVGWFECEAWPDPAPHIARLRTTLGEEAFSAAWSAGEAMTMSEALAYALGKQEVPGLV